VPLLKFLVRGVGAESETVASRLGRIRLLSRERFTIIKGLSSGAWESDDHSEKGKPEPIEGPCDVALV